MIKLGREGMGQEGLPRQPTLAPACWVQPRCHSGRLALCAAPTPCPSSQAVRQGRQGTGPLALWEKAQEGGRCCQAWCCQPPASRHRAEPGGMGCSGGGWAGGARGPSHQRPTEGLRVLNQEKGENSRRGWEARGPRERT